MWTVQPSFGDIVCLSAFVAGIGTWAGYDWRPWAVLAASALAQSLSKALLGHIQLRNDGGLPRQ